MKRIIYLIGIVLLLSGCKTTYDYGYDVRDLRSGMTKYEVERLIGPAERILEINWTPYGYEEILQYRNNYWDRYALIYLEGILVDAQYIYDGYWYYPQVIRPPMGGAIFPPAFIPGRPTPMPPASQRPPINRPPTTSRPPATNNQLPAASEREPSNTSTVKPGNTGSSNTSRQPGTSTGTRQPANTNTNSGSSGSTRQPASTSTNSGSSTTRQQSSTSTSSGSSSSSRQPSSTSTSSGSSTSRQTSTGTNNTTNTRSSSSTSGSSSRSSGSGSTRQSSTTQDSNDNSKSSSRNR